MARICSLDIQYKNQSFPALISIQQLNDDIVCTIHFVESRLGYLLIGDRLVYSQKEGMKHPADLPTDLQMELQRCIRLVM
jgi:hypothetical protein